MAKLTLLRGDITKVKVDAIVNAANSSLLGGGGVDGAIHRAGGAAILEECKKIRAKQGSLPTGKAVITTGGNLPATYVIHTVGPIWNGREVALQDQQLADCYTNSLQLAVSHHLKTIAFSNISTGVYQFPKERAAAIAIQAVRDFLATDETIEEVQFVCFDEENYKIYTQYEL